MGEDAITGEALKTAASASENDSHINADAAASRCSLMVQLAVIASLKIVVSSVNVGQLLLERLPL